MNLYDLHKEDLKHKKVAIANIPKLAYQYAMKIGKRFPEGEKAIATDHMLSYYYARDIIKGPFPEGETAIANHAAYAYLYANHVLKDRFPEGEKTIAKAKAAVKVPYENLFGIIL